MRSSTTGSGEAVKSDDDDDDDEERVETTDEDFANVGGRTTLRALATFPADRCFIVPAAAVCRGSKKSMLGMRSDAHDSMTPASQRVCLFVPGIERFFIRPTTPCNTCGTSRGHVSEAEEE